MVLFIWVRFHLLLFNANMLQNWNSFIRFKRNKSPLKKSEFWHIFSKLPSKSLDLVSEILKNCVSPKTDVQIKIQEKIVYSSYRWKGYIGHTSKQMENASPFVACKADWGDPTILYMDACAHLNLINAKNSCMYSSWSKSKHRPDCLI